MGAAPRPDAGEALRACFLHAMGASVGRGIGQLVGQRPAKDHRNRLLRLVRGGGQGRGRTVDLPIFRTRDVSPPSIVRVRDLHRGPDPNAAERGRTLLGRDLRRSGVG